MTAIEGRPAISTLLIRLSEASPSWLVWKNVDSALGGTGDVDSVAPTRDWPRLIEVFGAWADEAGLRPAIVCRHLPGALFLVACDRASGRLVELDVYSHLVLRGAAYVDSAELEPLAQDDPRGFRRLRPGAEGLLLLLAMRPDERIRALLGSDPEGVAQTAGLFGRAARPAERYACAALAGEHDRQALTRWRLGALIRVARRPHLAGSRLLFGLGRGNDCPVLAALAAGRRIPPDAETWLGHVGRTHTIAP